MGTKQKMVNLTIALGALALLFFVFNRRAPTQNFSDTISPAESKMEKSGKLVIEDLVVGTGPEATSGNTITVNYKGALLDGTQFDSSYERGVPFTFSLGAGAVISGWDQGFAEMKVGGKRKLTIPANLGYGAQGAGDQIPPNSTLVFEIELLEVKQRVG